MTETTTPTEGEVVENSGVENVQDTGSTLPEDGNTENSAVENQGDTSSENDGDTGSTDSTNEDEPKVDASLKKFAKGQGFDPENLSAGEVKALTLLKNRISKERADLQSKNNGAVEGTIKSVKADSDMTDREYVEFVENKRDMVDSIRQYWAENPDDKQYETEALAILQREKETYGDDAMVRLAANMPRLLREAKFAAGAFDTESIAEKARREERERIRKTQEGSAEGGNASTEENNSSSEDVQEFLKNYDPSDPEQRKKADELIAKASRGKLY